MKAIIIGAGPSIFEKNHLEMLAKSNFQGYVMPCDRILKYTLECGITPTKFANYYTGTINDCIITHKAWYQMELFFNHPIVKEHAKNIKCFASSQVHPKQIKYLSKIGFVLEGYYHQYGKTKLYDVTKNKSLMELKDCDNVCMALWGLAKNYFSCSEIAFLGVDLSYSTYDTELYAGNNPTWDDHLSCMLQELESCNVKSYNCTQGGRLYGPGITDCTLTNFLNLKS